MKNWFVLLIMMFPLASCLHSVSSEESSTELKKDSSANLTTEKLEIKSKADFESQWKTLVGDKVCNTVDDCQLIGIGSRPCGGPDEYRVFSTASGDGRAANREAIEELAKHYTDWKKTQQQGMVGICVVAKKPSFTCTESRCQINQ